MDLNSHITFHWRVASSHWWILCLQALVVRTALPLVFFTFYPDSLKNWRKSPISEPDGCSCIRTETHLNDSISFYCPLSTVVIPCLMDWKEAQFALVLNISQIPFFYSFYTWRYGHLHIRKFIFFPTGKVVLDFNEIWSSTIVSILITGMCHV